MKAGKWEEGKTDIFRAQVPHLPYLLKKECPITACYRNTIMQESEERQRKDSLVFKNKQRQLLLVTATWTFHTTSVLQQISFLSGFPSELGRRNPGFGRRCSEIHTHRSNIIGSVLEASNTSSPRETSVPNFSVIPPGSSFCKRLWLLLALSLTFLS